MATKMLRTAVLYAGQTYGPGEVDTDDMVEGADEAFEERGYYGDEPMPHLTDHSQYDPDQTPRDGPPGELGDADMTEAPRKPFDTRPSLPGSETAPVEDAPSPRSRRSSSPAKDPDAE